MLSYCVVTYFSYVVFYVIHLLLIISRKTYILTFSRKESAVDFVLESFIVKTLLGSDVVSLTNL